MATCQLVSTGILASRLEPFCTFVCFAVLLAGVLPLEAQTATTGTSPTQ
jgi:hypothetical protein